MRTPAEGQKQPQKPFESKVDHSAQDVSGAVNRDHALLRLQRTIGNQGVLRVLRALGSDAARAGLETNASGELGAGTASRTYVALTSTGIASVPGTIRRAPANAPARTRHSLKVRIKIADDVVIVEDERGHRKFAGLFSTMPKELSKRLIDEVKGRLSFLSDEGFQVFVEFGQFAKRDLTVAGNIQVFLVDELQESVKPGEIMRTLYGYSNESAQDANKSFTDVHNEGPGSDLADPLGETAPARGYDVPGTSRPVFVKIPQLFSRDELTHYRQGSKEEAELGVDQIAATTSHELGHVLNSEPDGGHATGTFNHSKQNFPPDMMDTLGAQANYTRADGGGDAPRLSTAANDTLDKNDLDELGGLAHVWNALVLPNMGNGKVIKRAIFNKDGGLDIWYDLTKIGYSRDEKGNMIEFLKGIEMAEANNMWGRRR